METGFKLKVKQSEKQKRYKRNSRKKETEQTTAIVMEGKLWERRRDLSRMRCVFVLVRRRSTGKQIDEWRGEEMKERKVRY